jgi:hypothetical protein
MVPLVLEKAETYLWLGSGFGRSGPVSLEPEEIFHQHPVLTSFDSWEAPVARMPDMFVDIAAWGSRYPNHDTGTPTEAIDMLQAHDVDEAVIAHWVATIELFDLKVSVSRRSEQCNGREHDEVLSDLRSDARQRPARDLVEVRAGVAEGVGAERYWR